MRKAGDNGAICSVIYYGKYHTCAIDRYIVATFVADAK